MGAETVYWYHYFKPSPFRRLALIGDGAVTWLEGAQIAAWGKKDCLYVDLGMFHFDRQCIA
jgi:hypothetical protein